MSKKPIETYSRIVADVEESLKVWFAHYCRKNRTNMSTMLRFLISSLRDESYVKEEKEQE